jgi:hypothetical protein
MTYKKPRFCPIRKKQYTRIRATKGVIYGSTVKKRIYGNYLASVQKSKETRGKVSVNYRALYHL